MWNEAKWQPLYRCHHHNILQSHFISLKFNAGRSLHWWEDKIHTNYKCWNQDSLTQYTIQSCVGRNLIWSKNSGVWIQSSKGRMSMFDEYWPNVWQFCKHSTESQTIHCRKLNHAISIRWLCQKQHMTAGSWFYLLLYQFLVDDHVPSVCLYWQTW